MQYVFFTKTLKALPIPELIEALREMGADGADLCVRDGYPVSPANARKELPAAVKLLKQAGMSVPMISAPTDLNSASDPIAEPLFAACHDAGIPCIKPGYWTYRSGDYGRQVLEARKELAGFAALAERYGVKCCVHTHSGSYLSVNAAATWNLVHDSKPEAVGYFLDPGHLVLNGEPLPMAFGIAGDRLALVAIKDLMWTRSNDDAVRRSKCVPLGEGFVNWRQTMRELASRSFAGALTFHSEYEGYSAEQVIAQSKADMRYLREVERSVGQAR